MPLELHIIRAREFVRLKADHHIDLEASKATLTTLATACRKRGIDQALLDLRDFRVGPTPIFSPADLSELVNTFHEIGFRKAQRLAVLYTEDPHRRARLFAFIGTLKGWNVAAFDNFEEALMWLAGEETLDLEAGASEEPVRVKKRSNVSNPNSPRRERY